jgi:hypothetical protein
VGRDAFEVGTGQRRTLEEGGRGREDREEDQSHWEMTERKGDA